MIRFYTTLACFGLISSVIGQSGHGPSITLLTATQAETDTGNRSSDTDLKMIAKDGGRTASLEATTSGTLASDEPEWSGNPTNSVNGSAGSLTASWAGSSSGNATATLNNSNQKTVTITIFQPLPQNITIGVNKTGEKETKEQITPYMRKYSTTPTYHGSGGISVTTEQVEMYDDGSVIGKKVTFGGTGSFGYAEIEAPFLPIVFAPGVTANIIAKFQRLAVTASVVGTFDESLADPLSDEIQGTIAGQAGLEAGIGITGGLAGVAAVTASATGSTNVSVTGRLVFRDRKLYFASLSIEAGRLVGQASVELELLSARVQIYSKEWSAPEDASLNYELTEEQEIYALP